MNTKPATLKEQELVEAFATCAKEQIHVPGSIQPHGLLLALTDNMVIEQISDNVEQFLHCNAEEVLGNQLSDVFDKESTKTIELLTKQSKKQNTPQSTHLTIKEGKIFDIVVHYSGEVFILELEPVLSEAEDISFQTMYSQLDYFTRRLQKAKNIEKQCQITAEEIHKLTGFGRTKIYQFDEDWHGHVIAESKDKQMKSYLGHHFPAGDVPKQARALYVKNPLRLISDVDYKPSALHSNNEGILPLDMSLSILRSVSSVHLQYLRHMNIAASMSISILQGEKLWGLICCHHDEAKYVSYPIRMIAQLIGEILALQLSVLTTSQELAYKEKVQRSVSQLTSKLRNKTTTQNVDDTLPEIMQAIDTSGIVLQFGHQTSAYGKVPTKKEISKIIQWLKESNAEELFDSDNVSSQIKISSKTKAVASGLLAIRIGKNADDYMLWFRPEIVETIKWAGNPDLAKNLDATGKFLNPRQSFDLWEQTVKEIASPWQEIELEAAQQLADTVNACWLDQRLKESYEEIETFIYITSHDFRTPLINLKGFAQEMQRSIKKLQEALKDPKEDISTIIEKDIGTALHFIDNAVDKLDVMTSAMLELSRTGKRELAFKPIDTKKLVDKCIKSLHHQITEKNILTQVNELPDVTADFVSLQQIFGNIIDNAIKYLDPTRSGVVEVSAKETDVETIFHIKDNGLGIEKKICIKYLRYFVGLVIAMFRVKVWEWRMLKH